MNLTPRLQTIVSMVKPSQIMADIGTDHAYIPIWLVQQGKVKQAIASDIHEGPAVRAQENIRKNHLEKLIEVRVGAGLSTIGPGEVNGAVIAGMGGLMIKNILKNDLPTASALDWLVLEPQGHVPELRHWLNVNHFTIQKEKLAVEDGKYYEVMLVKYGGKQVLSEASALVGLLSDRMKDPLFPLFLDHLLKLTGIKEKGLKVNIGSERNRKSLDQVRTEKSILEDILWKLQQKKSFN